jgi:putative membrane protein
MMGQYWDQFGAFGMGFGWLSMILFSGLVLLAGFALLRWLVAGNAAGAGAARKSAIEILQERYARGEIGREEYEQKSRDISSSR